MKTLHNFLIAVLSTLIFYSCVKVIEFNGEQTEPMIVVNSFVTPDSLIYAQISKSKFFLSNKTGFDYINNADVSLYINNIFKEKLAFTTDGLYTSTQKPGIGDTIRFYITATGLDDVESVSIVPDQPVILSADTTFKISYTNYQMDGEDTIGYYQGGELSFKIKLKDESSLQNYYRLTLKKHAVIDAGESTTYEDEFYLPFILEGFENTNTGGGLFDFFGNMIVDSKNQYMITDELFNGKEFVLRFTALTSKRVIKPGYEDRFYYSSDNIVSEEYIVNLQGISKDMYLYLKSKEMAEGIMNGVFTEPVQIYNNISNGIGILGSYTSNRVVIKTR
ncbi:MAG: DUF4249 domain-containing protein [Paludibacter sp.]|nr:DUF4249 domain-containing protein [Paludibacter sp.]